MLLQCLHSWDAFHHEGIDHLHGDASKSLILFASIAQWSTFQQACFALTSAQVFSRTDLTTDSECFYGTILELLKDPDEKDEVEQLLAWWNR